MAVSVSPPRGGNLPVDVTSFVGRRHELGDVPRSLSDFRLVTLTGVGGVGKTRLALRVARELHRPFRDGVWLVDVAGVNDPALLAPAVASALGLRAVTADWQVSRLAEHLADRQVLLVLDNCEHMVAGARCWWTRCCVPAHSCGCVPRLGNRWGLTVNAPCGCRRCRCRSRIKIPPPAEALMRV
ncbi:hypothetical protein GCM10009827_118350 [Dactylosporangium maewongense]|uniref:ORC1/DEAH AAA+ ATPase domain-containing protein n=1 Tax=Dactylosporangium maewongense TaxID=634393 RepID=A0ABN2DGL0_9ACTN